MNRWLFKADPDAYGWADLVKAKKDRWDGVSNPLALKHLRGVKTGDQIFIYHTGKEKAVVGIAKAVSDNLDISPVGPLKRPVSLSEIKSNAKLRGWELVRMSRLSVMPVTPAQWSEVTRQSEKS